MTLTWEAVTVSFGWEADTHDPPRFRQAGTCIELGGSVRYVGDHPHGPTGPAFVLPEGARPAADTPWAKTPGGPGLVRWARILAGGEVFIYVTPDGELPPLLSPAPDDARAWLRVHGPLEIRSSHPFAFRRGQWARLVLAWDDPVRGRVCWLVRWPDLVSDYLVVADALAAWEYRRA